MQNVDDKEVAKRLREILNDKRAKSPRSFALSIDQDPSFFTKILKAEKTLTENVAQSITKKYGVNVEWLFSGTLPKYISAGSASREGKEPYLEELLETLKSHNNFLQDLVKSNLDGLLSQQLTIQAEVQAIHQWDAQRTAAGDEGKEAKFLDHIQKLSARNLEKLRKKNKSAGNGR